MTCESIAMKWKFYENKTNQKKHNQKYVIIGFQLIKMQNEREKKDLTVSDVSACGRNFDF